jgi:PKD-like domain
MKIKLISAMMVGLLFVCTAFSPVSAPAFDDAALPPTCPGNPTVNGSTDNDNYIHATALLKTYKDGYEWTVSSGAFIISGQGTNQISIGKDCPTGSVTACVRAYINQPGGGICYSAEVCTVISYSGPCFII